MLMHWFWWAMSTRIICELWTEPCLQCLDDRLTTADNISRKVHHPMNRTAANMSHIWCSCDLVENLWIFDIHLGIIFLHLLQPTRNKNVTVWKNFQFFSMASPHQFCCVPFGLPADGPLPADGLTKVAKIDIWWSTTHQKIVYSILHTRKKW